MPSVARMTRAIAPSYGRNHDEQGERDQTVDRVLDANPGRSRGVRMNRDERDSAEIVDRQIVWHPLEQPGDDRHTDAAPRALVDHPQHHRVRSCREREEDMLDAVRFDHLAEIPTGTEHRQGRAAIHAVRVLQRVLVEEADRCEADLAMLLSRFARTSADASRADDQRRTVPPSRRAAATEAMMPPRLAARYTVANSHSRTP